MWRLAIIGLSFAICDAVTAAPQSIALSVATMVCGPDPLNIKLALQAVPGVTDVQISLENKTAMVSFDNEKSSVDALLQAIAGAGYAALPAHKP